MTGQDLDDRTRRRRRATMVTSAPPPGASGFAQGMTQWKKTPPNQTALPETIRP